MSTIRSAMTVRKFLLAFHRLAYRISVLYETGFLPNLLLALVTFYIVITLFACAISSVNLKTHVMKNTPFFIKLHFVLSKHS